MNEIAFIIPIYNVNIINLKKSIENIKKQNIEKYEIIIINDGSIDNDIEKYCKKIESDKIKYFYQENSGAAVARNLGIEKLNSEYLMFVDADDELNDDFYQEFKKIKNKLYDIMIFDYSIITTDMEKRKTLLKEKNLTNEKKELYKNILYHPSKFNDFLIGSIWAKCFSVKFLRENNIKFVPRLRKAQDRVFMLYAINKSKNIYYYPIQSYRYNQNENSICHKMNFKMIDYYSYLYEEVEMFCENIIHDNNINRFFNYYIFNEALLLTIFNDEYKEKLAVKKKKYYEYYKIFNLKNCISKLKISDFCSMKAKIRFICLKYNMFILLYMLIKLKAKAENRNNFK